MGTAQTGAYRIERQPDLASVTPGALVRYECRGPRTLTTSPTGNREMEVASWWICRDRSAEGGDLQFVRGFHAKEGDGVYGWSRAYEWNLDPGNYLVMAAIGTRGSQQRQLASLRQHVMSPEEVKGELARVVSKARRDTLANPDEADSLVGEQLVALVAIAKHGPPLSPGQQEEHGKSVERWKSVRKKLAERLAPTQGLRRIPILAVHYDFTTQQRRQLNFFLVEMPTPEPREHEAGAASGAEGASGSGGRTEHVFRLVDWTNPAERAESSESEGQGATAKQAILDTCSDWDWWRGRYPRGRIVFEVPARACGEALKLEYETNGATTWDKVVGALTVTAVVAGMIVIGVATLGAAVPAEIAAATGTAALIVSTASGAGAEIISIAVRRAEGIHDTRADAVSLLGILASLFQLRWLKGAKVTLAGRPATYRFLGHVAEGTVNLAQGVLILDREYEEVARELERLRKDPTLSPEERARQIYALFVRLVQAGVLTYMSLRSDAAQLKELAAKRGIPADKTKLVLTELEDESKTVNLGEPKATKGKVEQGKARTVVETREAVPARGPWPPVKNPLLTPPPGTRASEDRAFRKLSKDRIIFVRDSNPARTKDFPFPVTAKTDKCKFKTLKSSPSTPERFVGLAAAGPDDPEVKEILRLHGWDFHRDEQQLREHIQKEERLKMAGAEESYILRNDKGEALVGDIDIHGVYDLERRRRIELNETEQIRFNKALKREVVTHGAQDDWPEKLDKIRKGKPNINYGPQPPVTAYVNGEAKQLETWKEMKAFAKDQYGIDLETEYAGIDWDFWREMRTKSGKGTE
jgi:hypothetical protein